MLLFLKKPLFFDLLALLAGLLLPFAFAPFNLSVLAFISPALLLFIVYKTNGLRAFHRGFLYGLGYFGLGVSWVYVSMSVYGGFSAPLAFIITLLLIIILSLFPACQIYYLRRFFPNGNGYTHLLAFPASWALMDYLRTVIGTGFPWLLLGYTQVNTYLGGLAPLVGVYGLSFLTCYTSAAGLILLTRQPRRLKMITLFSLILIWGLAALLTPISWTHQGQSSQVSLIQGNISQERKWDPHQLPFILETYQNLTEKQWDSSLIVWPEAAIPIVANQVDDYLDYLSKQASKNYVSLLIGAPIQQQGNYYNAVITLGNAKGIYLKHHLVPFGEYIPFKTYLSGLFTWLRIPMSDLSPGRNSKKQALLIGAGMPIASFICYEIAYPTQVLEATHQGAELLVVVTDDSWFGRSFASAQHLQMAQMRALETGKYVLFSGNTGISAIIQPNGRLLATLPEFQQGVLTGKIYAMRGNTLLAYLTHHGILIFFLGLLVFVWYNQRNVLFR